ncbi:MAG: phosphate acetyltransferase [Bacteroidetes bacterium]|nr:phosphate acetyltransferase [Bacteroidota bacterium]MBL6944628.1 phosphate acetyltransferase [Bacteroidales bacterium]
MSKNLYIAAAEAEAGKSMIILGIMDFLSSHIDKIGFFRPIVRSGEVMDNHIRLISSRYNLDFEYASMYGLTSNEMLDFHQTGDTEGVYTSILDKYKLLEQRCDFILVEGSDFRSHLSTYEIDFNLRVANNLGCPIITIVSGFNKDISEVSESIQIMRRILAREKCIQLGTIVNRAQKDDVESIRHILQKGMPESGVNCVIPEEPSLQKLTMRQIKDAINAKQLYGDKDSLSYDVVDFKVAAMNIDNVLNHLSEGTLIITPGDRLDVLMGLSLTLLSDNYPKIAGILLTCGFEPANNFKQLIYGLKKLPIAILSVDSDTFTAAAAVNNVRPLLLPENEQRIATALGLFEKHVNIKELAKKITIARSNVVTPVMFEYELFNRAKQNRKHIVLPEGNDDRVLRAASILLRRNVVDLTILGNEEEILTRAAALHINLAGAFIIDPYDNDLIGEYATEYFRLRKHKGISKEAAKELMYDVSYLGTMMVHKGHADGMVSGAAHTTQHTIRPAFEIIKTKPGISIVSSSFLMCLEDRVLVYGDCAINPNPDARQLADIAISSAKTASMFGIEPRIAMLSYSTGSSGKGKEVEKVREATEIVKRLRPDLKIEGPIQYDAAIDASVAKTKMPNSEVAGKATIFIFPDLNTGNNTYKAVQRSANAVAIGPVLQGLNKPVNDLSRGCLVTDIVNTVVITAIQAQEQ